MGRKLKGRVERREYRRRTMGRRRRGRGDRRVLKEDDGEEAEKGEWKGEN